MIQSWKKVNLHFYVAKSRPSIHTYFTRTYILCSNMITLILHCVNCYLATICVLRFYSFLSQSSNMFCYITIRNWRLLLSRKWWMICLLRPMVCENLKAHPRSRSRKKNSNTASKQKFFNLMFDLSPSSQLHHHLYLLFDTSCK